LNGTTLGAVGIWTDRLDGQPMSTVRETAARIEDLGYGTLWLPEGTGREAMAQAALLLAATRHITVATGIASIYARDAVTMTAGQRTLTEAFPGRFLLGIGVSHPSLVEDVRGHRFGPPVATMRAYLDAMDAAPYGPTTPTPARILGAVGPRMLALAAERADGAAPLGMPAQHTAATRKLLGPDALLAVMQIVITDADPAHARDRARAVIPAMLPNRRPFLLDLGFTDDDLDTPIDEVVDALIMLGGPDDIAARVRAHLDAGADHVALHVISDEPDTVPLREWAAFSPAAG
jgi:probable F420-dependent oxidoreductase